MIGWIAFSLLFVYTVNGQRVDGGLSQWMDETACSVSCGGGTKFQFRLCNNPSPSSGGLGCDPEQATFRQVTCGTDSCIQVCEYSKPCSCENIPKYTTGNEPNLSLNRFPNMNPTDIETARHYLTIWTKENFQSFCEAAKCNQNQLQGAIMNLTSYTNNLKILDDFHIEGRKLMHQIIDCNDNEEIEGNLWRVYDYMCEHGVAIKEIREDLEQKQGMFEAEKQRCSENTWFTGMVQKFYKKW